MNELKLKKDSSLLPCLEICILHSGQDHSQQRSTSCVTCKYKDAEGNVTDIDVEKCDTEAYTDSLDEDFTCEYQGGLITIKRSTINELRKQNHYYGPLKVMQKLESETNENGTAEKVYSTCLEPVDFSVMQNGDRSINDQEINSLLNRKPGIIPSCNPLVKKHLEHKFTIFRKGKKKYNVSNSSLQFFRERTGYGKNLDFKVEEIFHTSDEKIGLLPVTILTIFKNKKKKVFRGVNLYKRKKKLIRKKKMLKAQKDYKIKHSYIINHSNWSQRGNLYFTEINRVGINFIDELLIECPVQDDLKEFSESLSSNSDEYQVTNRYWQDIDNVEDIQQEGSNEYAYVIWNNLIKAAKQNPLLISFEYEMENEKWLELRRKINIFQINGESLADIILKVVLREGGCTAVNYYVRCLNRCTKQGILSSVMDVNFLLKIFDTNKFVCIGLDKEKYIYQCDENELLRQHLKENGQLAIFPFESIRDKKCKGIVSDFSNSGNFKFERGNGTIYGPLIVCWPCEKLFNKLEELYEPSLNVLIAKKGFHRMTKQRFGPIHSTHISRNIKKLCLETPFEFISQSQKVSDCKKLMFENGILPKQLKLFDFDTDLCEDDRPVIKVSEQEFDEMISIKGSTEQNAKLIKSCKKCGFQASTMLSLFLHMSGHIGMLTEVCNLCSLKLSNKEAFKQHLKQCHSKEDFSCTICPDTFSSKEDLFVHLNCHRTCQPYVCIYCEQRHQTLEIYRKHMKHTHKMETLEELNFHCQICSSNFVTYDHLLVHRLNNFHTDKNSLKCKICNFSCTLVSAFQTHLLSHTFEQREYHNLAMCQECKKAFFSTFELEDHLKEHKNIIIQHKEIILSAGQEIHADKSNKVAKIITCKKCSKAFGTEKALQKHFEVCAVDKSMNNNTFSSSAQHSFSCYQCFMKFTSEYFLNVHMNSHTASHSFTFQSEDSSFRTVHNKPSQSLDHIAHTEESKNVEKHQLVIQQHQQSQENSYNQLYSQAQHPQISFANNSVPIIVSESPVIQAPVTTSWNQQQNPSTLEESHDSVYSLLHL